MRRTADRTEFAEEFADRCRRPSAGHGASVRPGRPPDQPPAHLHALAAAAGRGLVRIVEDEVRGQLVELVVHFRAQQEKHGLRIDQNLDALVLDDLVDVGATAAAYSIVYSMPAQPPFLTPTRTPVNGSFAFAIISLMRSRRRRSDASPGVGAVRGMFILSSRSNVWRFPRIAETPSVYLGALVGRRKSPHIEARRASSDMRL